MGEVEEEEAATGLTKFVMPSPDMPSSDEEGEEGEEGGEGEEVTARDARPIKTPLLKMCWHTHLPVLLCVMYSASVSQRGEFLLFSFLFLQQMFQRLAKRGKAPCLQIT